MTTSAQTSYRSVFAVTFARFFSPFTLFIWLACWIITVMAGPFGTYEALGVGRLIAYWGLIVTAGMVLGYTAFALTMCVLKSEKSWGFPFLAAGILTLMFAPAVIAVRSVFAAYADGLQVNPVAITLNTFFITLAVFCFRRVLWASPKPVSFDQHVEAEPEAEIEPRLMRRLPDEVKGPILRVSANDHRVEVVTTKGQHDLRMRLVDAIDEMDPIEGLCVHRSHWVALSAIARIERMNAHKTCVHLINGDEIPASRKYRDGLVEAGLIES